MKVYLKSDVPGLGKADEVKDVSDGYARNYLIPRGLAAPATKGLVKASRKRRTDQAVHSARRREHAEEIGERLRSETVRFKAKAGETGRLYGSITSADIAKKLSKFIGGQFDKRDVLLERSIREIGIHMVDLKLDEGVRAQVRVIVEAEA